MYDYPLLADLSTEEIIDVIALYNAVEQAYEDKVKKEEFINKYKRFQDIVNSKSLQKQLDKEFQKVSSYSIYEVYKASLEDTVWISL